MSRFKVALFTGNYNHIRDGVSLTLNRLVAYLLENDIEVLVFGPTIDEPALDHSGTLISVPSMKLPGRPEYRFSRSFPGEQKQKLREFNPDITHIATPDLLGYKALKWAIKHNKPVVSSYHTHFSSYLKYYKISLLEPAMWKYLSWFYRKCKLVFVPSPSMQEILEEKKIETDFRIWARGIESKIFNPQRRSDEWRKKHGFEPDDIVITFISRLVWEKNLKLFADVVNKITKKREYARALIVGDGPAMSEMKELMPDTVFTGFLGGTDLATAYASSDIFFFPSDTETFGNVTLEAMASGLPAVVADATGSRSLVEDGKNGFVIPVESTDKFYTFIDKLVTDSELRKRMGQVGLEKSKSYSWDAINNNLVGYYREVLKGKG
ncbi:MAG: glycosyltransferase family 1 protein [Balneolaceae bacterium]|nr:MAG: glycosyltransferase family 1 protein [Balneolaceae bacterium]